MTPIFRSTIVKRMVMLLFICFLLISLFHYYKYVTKVDRYAPSEDYLTKLEEAKLRDSQSSLLTLSKKAGVDQHVSATVPPSINQGGPQGTLNEVHSSQGVLNSLPINANIPPGGVMPDNEVISDKKGEVGDTKLHSAPPPPDKGSVDSPVASANLPDLHLEDKLTNQVTDESCVKGRNIAQENEWSAEDVKTSRQTSERSQERAKHVKQMMMHAWSNYKKYAWGSNELAPVYKRPHVGIFGGTKIGLTIVDSLDTLWLMGLFEEVKEGKDWLIRNLPAQLNVSVDVSVFEFNIRFVGGLLSMYALTNECEYKELSVLCADKLIPAFNTTHGLPVSHVNLKHGYNNRYGQFGMAVLSEFGTLHLEFFYLSHITGNNKYRELVEKVRDTIVKARSMNGLYGNKISIDTAQYSGNQMTVSLGGAGDSFYEYLFKSYLQTERKDTKAKDLYFEAIQAIIKSGMLQTSKSGLKYFGIKQTGTNNIEHKMEHLACFIGGVMGMSAKYSDNATATLQLAEDIASTCHESYIRSDSGLGPESFNFDNSDDATSKYGDKSYHLRPEVVESWFFLSRITGNSKYREWAAEFIKALEKYCRMENGYVGLHDVYLKKTGKDNKPLQEDVQQSFFMAETLKYLYLIFKDEAYLPLDDWVFNTEAHPLPVIRQKL